MVGSGRPHAPGVRTLVKRMARFGRPADGRLEPVRRAGVQPEVRTEMVVTRSIEILLDVLRGRAEPVVLDLGRLVGENLDFLGAAVGCKLLVADLFSDLEGRLADDPAPPDETWVTSRITREAASVDAILCWDTLEYLTEAEGRTLAARLTRVLRPHGVLLMRFSGALRSEAAYATYAIVDPSTLRRRVHAAIVRQRRVLMSREVTDMFEGLSIVEAFLLTTQVREMVFRKPPGAAGGRAR